MKKFLFSLTVVSGLLTLVNTAHAGNTSQASVSANGAVLNNSQAATQVSSATLAANQQAQVILSSPTSVNNQGVTYQFVYLTDVHIEMYATGTLTGGAVPVKCTTTGLPGSPTFLFPTAAATGTVNFYNIDYVYPLRATASGTQVTITCPATASVIWNVIANSYNDN